MPDPVEPAAFVTLDELQPSVELLGRYEYHQDERYPYRVPGQHFLLVVDGRIDGESPTAGTATARAGEMLCFPAADLNRYAVHAPTRYYEAHVLFARPPRHRHQVWLDGLGPLPLHVRLGGAAERMRTVFDEMCLNLPQPGGMHRARVLSALWEMLAILAECARPARGADAPRLDAWQRARHRLGADLGRELTLREVADEAGLSVDHFIRGFRSRFGTSPARFRLEQKLRHAAHRLRAGEEPIKAIAADLGFADSYSFTRAFRRYLGVLPSDLREGRAAPPAVAQPEKPLIPLNTHILPPQPGADHYQQFAPRGR